MKLTGMRNRKGSGILEGVVGLSLVIGGLVAATLFIGNVSLLGNFQSKLNFVTIQAAQYAARNGDSSNITNDTHQFVKETMKIIGMPNADTATVTVTPQTVNGQQGMLVEISGQFPTLGNESWIPSIVRLRDKEFALGDSAVGYLRVPGLFGPDCIVPVAKTIPSGLLGLTKDIISITFTGYPKYNNKPVYPELAGFAYSKGGLISGVLHNPILQ